MNKTAKPTLSWCSAVEGPPVNAGDTDLTPGPGRPHMLPGQLSPCTTAEEPEFGSLGTTATEPVQHPHLEPVPPNKRSHHSEGSAHCPWRATPAHSERRDPRSHEDSAQPRVNQWFCCCSVSTSSPTLCDPMDCSTPGCPVHHQLLELTETH